MKSACLVLAVLFLLSACMPGPLTPAGPSPTAPSLTPSSAVTSTSTPSETPVPAPTTAVPPQHPTDTPTATAEVRISDTPLSGPTPTLACEQETAALVLSTDRVIIKVGDPIKVTATLSNEGCVALGLPQYRLSITSDGSGPIFAPELPDPVVHYLAVGPGQLDAVEFTLMAVAAGQATITATVSYEVHLGYPGPAYWGSTAVQTPLILTATP